MDEDFVSNLPASHPPPEFLQLCWTHSRDAILVADTGLGTVVDVNPEASRLTGYSTDELIGKNLFDLHPDSEYDLAHENFRRAATSGCLITGLHFRHKSGRLIPVEISSSQQFLVDGRAVIVGIVRDVTDLEERDGRLAIKRWALRAYASAAMVLATARSLSSFEQEICEAITRDSIFVLAGIGYAEDNPRKLVHMAGAAGPALKYFDGLEVSWDENVESGRGPTGIAIRTNSVQILNDAETEDSFLPWRQRASEFGIHSSMTAPFEMEAGRSGVLMVYSSTPRAFGPIVSEAFTHLAAEIGVGLRSLLKEEQLKAEQTERERAQKDRADALSAVVSAINTAMEMRDAYTAGHQSRVAAIACAIGAEMGWSSAKLDGLRIAAEVHDIGKMSVPQELLTKPGQLTSAEWTVVKNHVDAGYSILKDVPFSWPIAEAVYQHHERLDGSGYPRGLKGEEIMMGARIIAVADVVESMASARPYRPAHGLHAALAEIESESGTRLDPEVVSVCLSLFRDKGFIVPAVKTGASPAAFI